MISCGTRKQFKNDTKGTVSFNISASKDINNLFC